jgi:hypothetical protein
MEFINRVRVELLDERKAFHVFATSLGREGMFLRSNDPLPLGKKVALEFDTPQGTVRVDEGEVSWVKPPEPINTDGVPAGMDIAFCRLTAAARALIDALIDPAQTRSSGAAASRARPESPKPAAAPGSMTGPQDPRSGPSEFDDLFSKKVEATSMNAKEQAQTPTPVDLLARPDANFLLSSPPPAKRRILLLLGYVVIVAAVTFLAMYVFQPRQRALPLAAPEAQPLPVEPGPAGHTPGIAPQGTLPSLPTPAAEGAAASAAAPLPSAPKQEPKAEPQPPPPADEPLKVATSPQSRPERSATKNPPQRQALRPAQTRRTGQRTTPSSRCPNSARPAEAGR